jgi:hypothetical protein
VPQNREKINEIDHTPIPCEADRGAAGNGLWSEPQEAHSDDRNEIPFVEANVFAELNNSNELTWIALVTVGVIVVGMSM